MLFDEINRLGDEAVHRFPDPPQFVGSLVESIGWAMSSMQGLCDFVNMDAVGIAATLVVGSWVAGFAVRLFRVMVSYATLGGGMGA